MSNLSATSEPDHQVFVEQIKLLYHSLLPVIGINVLIALALVYTLWDATPHSSLIIWFSVMLIVLLLRGLNFVFYQNHFNEDNANKYALSFIVGSTSAGAVWGIGCLILFFNQSLEYQLFVLFVLAGMGGGSLSALSSYLPAFYSFFLITMLPVSLSLFFIETPIHQTLGVMSIIYITALCSFVLSINRSYRLSLQLRFENMELIEQLREQKDEADQANIAKSRFLSAASHDLRQPLYALGLFTSVLN